MGKKYVIELEEEPFVRQSALHGEEGLYRAVGFKSLVFDEYGRDKLTPLDDALDEAYAHGATEAEAKYHEFAKQVEENGYKKGLDDAWECAKRITAFSANGGLGPCELTHLFGTVSYSIVFSKHSASEAIQKIKEWEEQKQKEEDEIKVGDEIFITENGDDFNAVVIDMDGDNAMWVINENGCAVIIHPNEEYHKTGRHFAEIEYVLSKMRGEDDA